MPDFSDSLRAMVSDDARALAGAAPLTDTRRRIGRRRAAAAAGYGAGSALAIGGLAVAGTVLADRSPDPAGAASPQPSASIEPPVRYATVDLPTQDEMFAESPWCGSELPAAQNRDEGLMATTYLYVEAGTELVQSYEADAVSIASVDLAVDPAAADEFPDPGDGDVRAFVEPPQMVLARDGVVVAVIDQGSQTVDARLTDAWTSTQQAVFWGSISPCGSAGLDGPLEPGAYELATITQVTASERDSALYSLRVAGYELPPADALDLFAPGSYDCERMAAFGTVPLSCRLAAVPGASIDAEAGTATIPYDADLYSRDIHATFVSESITVTVSGDPRESETQTPPEAAATLEAGQVPACGETFGWADSGEVQLNWQADLAEIAPGDTFAPGVWVQGSDTEATVTLPESARIWLTQGIDVPYGDGISFAFAYQVVGWMDVHAKDGTSVEVNRYDGPEPWQLEVSDVSWCGGEPTGVSEGWMTAPHAVTDTAGTRESDLVIPVQAWM